MSRALKIVVGVVAVAVLGVGVLAVLANTVLKGSDSNSYSGSADNWKSVYAKGCEDREVTFTDWPVAPANLKAIIPMGSMYKDHVDPVEHVYNVTSASGPTPSVPIVMPADGWIVAAFNLAGLETNNGGNGPKVDLGVITQFSCRYFARILHIYALTPELEKAIGDAPTGDNKYVRIHLDAGQQIGFGGESSDFSIQDMQVDGTSKAFVNSQRYAGDAAYLHDIDPFSVYPAALRQKLDALSTRIVAPKAGRYDYDVPGSAQGTFFRSDGWGIVGSKQQPNGPSFWQSILALAPYWNDPSLSMVSTGHWKGADDASQFFTTDFIDFTTLKVGQTIVVGLVDANGFDKLKVVTKEQVRSAPVVGSAVIRVDAGERLSVELLPGKVPAQVSGFTGGEQIYERG